MSRFHSYMHSAQKAIQAHQPGKPFHINLKSFFTSNKQMGSKDRKAIGSLCYAYFRTGHLFEKFDIEQRILYSLFLCDSNHTDILAAIQPNLFVMKEKSFEEKCNFLHVNPNDIFKHDEFLSDAIDVHKWEQSILKQPALFLRIRPRKHQQVLEILKKESIEFEYDGKDLLQLKPDVVVEKYLKLNREVVVQDKSSQQVLDFISTLKDLPQMPTAWDCCAASGGKSILLYDKLNGKLNLTVSDIRTNILGNLRTRLGEAKISLQHCFVADLTDTIRMPNNTFFDMILCDAPCTGSGTWSRNPEQLDHFKEEDIKEYSKRQKQIIKNSLPFLKKQGYFIYITCSVLAAENEEIISSVQSLHSMKCIHQEYVKGYEHRADTMFVAVLRY